jgi:hypothetical protein
MADNPNLIDEKSIPGNLVPAEERPPVVPGKAPLGAPAPPEPNEMPQFFSGSMPPALQHDTSFVGTEVGTPRIPKYSLMPFGIQASGFTNAGIESTASKTPSSTPVTPEPDIESVAVNLQTGTTYTVKASDNDTLISLNNNSGGTVFLPPSVGVQFAFIQAKYFSGGGSAATTIVNGAGNTMFLQVDTSDVFTSPPTVHDSNGNTWTQITHVGNGGSTSVSYWYASNIVGGTNTITVTNASDHTFCLSVVAEYSGVGAFDTFSPPVIEPASTFLITSFANEVAIFSSSVTAGTPPTYGTAAGWIGRIVSPSNQVLEDKLVPNAGTNVTTTGALATFPPGPQVFAVFSFRLATIPAGPALAKGFFCWIENTGTGSFSVRAAVNIDGSSSPVVLGPNQGALFVFDGFNWYTERGIGGVDIDFYQTVQSSGVSKPQEPRLNFLSGFTVTDNLGNTSTDIGLSAFSNPKVEINGVGVSADKQFFLNGVSDGAAVWAVSINGTPDGG